MALDTDAINTEVRTVAGALDVSWEDFATYCKGKIIECTINGGITTYTINGRTVTKDQSWFTKAFEFAVAQANIQNSGGIGGQPISFEPRC